MKDFFRREPVAVVAAMQTTLALAVLFGVELSADQMAGIVTCVAAWLGLVTRRKVTPI
jgi:uncharacterized membrane protein